MTPKDRSLNVAMEVLAERDRQRNVEGWTPEHDDEHADGALLTAAVCYAQRRMDQNRFGVFTPSAPAAWPWDVSWWKPKDPRRDLIRAAALIVAEIERLDRAAAEKVARWSRNAGEAEASALPIWTCPSCGWRQLMEPNRPRICGRYGEPCPGNPETAGGAE